MTEREGTRAEFMEMAAQLRGQDVPTKAEVNRELVDSIHPAEPEDAQEPDQDPEELAARLLAPKAGHIQLVREMHGGEEPK